VANPIRGFGLICTRCCSAQCAHCGSSAVEPDGTFIALDLAERCLSCLPALGLSSFHLTGGEPMLYLEKVSELLRIGRAYGLSATMCSNAFWAVDSESARERLARLRDLGLTTLLLSTDRFHIRAVPVEAVVIAAREAETLGIACHVSIPSLVNDWVAISLLARLRAKTRARVMMHPAHPIGRGEDLPRNLFAMPSVEPVPCPYVGLIEVGVTGAVSCCPTGTDFPEDSCIILGNARERDLGEIIEDYRVSSVLCMLAESGPGGMLRLLRDDERGYEFAATAPSRHPCHVCRDLTRELWIRTSLSKMIGVESCVSGIDNVV